MQTVSNKKTDTRKILQVTNLVTITAAILRLALYAGSLTHGYRAAVHAGPRPMTITSLRCGSTQTLFRDPPPPDPAAQGAPRWLLIGALFVLAILLQMLRVGWSISLHSLWAEDGAVYFSGAVHNSFGGSLFDTYATYLVFVPRLIGEIGGLVPLQDGPAAISILSARRRRALAAGSSGRRPRG